MNWVQVPREKQERLLNKKGIRITEIVRRDGNITEIHFCDTVDHVAYKLSSQIYSTNLDLYTPEVTTLYMAYGKPDSLFSHVRKAFKTSGEASTHLHKLLGDAGISGGWEQYFEIKEEKTTDPSAFFSEESGG